MSTGGERLRAFLEQRMLERGSQRRGWVGDLERLTGIKRGTMATWWTGKKEPSMESFQALAEKLEISRVQLVAVLDGVGAVAPLGDPGTKQELRVTLVELLREPETQSLLRELLRRPPGQAGAA